MQTAHYKLVRLANGAHTVHATDYDEKMHPGLGPAAEAESLYVQQLRIAGRMREVAGEFVVWDVGLGAAANAIAVLRATRDIPHPLRLVSFDDTAEPLAFALSNADALGYLHDYESTAKALREKRFVEFQNGSSRVVWEFKLGDFPSWASSVAAGILPAVEPGFQLGGKTRGTIQRSEKLGDRPDGKMPSSASDRRPGATSAPHAILFDAFSPAKNPAMWTQPLFSNLFRLLEPTRPCALTTYSRSTMLRVTLLLAGFFVGRGVATGLKEETTAAANTLALIDQPLDRRWLERARRSDSAEPLHAPPYRRAPLSPESWEKLRVLTQFSS